MQCVTDHHAAAVHNKPNRLCMCPQKRHELWQHAQPVGTLSSVKQEKTQTRAVSTPSQSSKSCRSLMRSGTCSLLCCFADLHVFGLFLIFCCPQAASVSAFITGPFPIHVTPLRIHSPSPVRHSLPSSPSTPFPCQWLSL